MANGERTAKVKAFAKRIREPSSWAGIAVILTLLGLPAPVLTAAGALLDVAPSLIDTGAALLAAAAAIGLHEKSGG